MSRCNPVQEISDLLKELEMRTFEDSRLVEEWNAAQLEFPGELLSEEHQASFREWFLLERESPTLGTSPIVAFAPSDAESEDTWSRLMDSFLGVFQHTGGQRLDDGSQALELCDLWSGRVILIQENGATDHQNLDEHSLIFGRFVLADEPFHASLPSVRTTSLPGLAAALEVDLAEARKQHSRAKLSQFELEKISLSIPGLIDEDEAASRLKLEEELDGILIGQPKWDLDRVQDSLARAGLSETLNALAFDTDLDLEQLRRILPAYHQVLIKDQGQLASANELKERPYQELAAEEIASSDMVNEAIQNFEQHRQKGASVEHSFAELEKALGIADGTSSEEDFVPSSEEQSVGPQESGGIRSWIAAFTWEKGITTGVPFVLNQFADFLEAQELSHIDAQDLKSSHLLPFLFAAGSPAAVSERHARLRDFLEWAEFEQSAQLGALAFDKAVEFMGRFIGILKLNQSFEGEGEWQHRTRVLSLSPLSVATDNKDETAEVVGIPEDRMGLLRIGDLLLGSWVRGSFNVASVLPVEAFPEAAEDQE